MHDRYIHADVESAARHDWKIADSYKAQEDSIKPKFYCVSMLPYPSGKLHMGHVRNYTINDVIYRYLRMNDYNVLMPMGWDAFGMPSENAAIANDVSPAKWTYDNIRYMKSQMHSMGLAIDWSREVVTCKSTYYKWNQWLFLKMLEKGIAYKKIGFVNWDPVDQTVLANEQVINGCGWRSGAPVEKREIPMYYLRITQYADKLLNDLDGLAWPENVKIMQKNWIGKSFGMNIGFPYEIDNEKKLLRVFTTRADTIMGVTFCAIAPEHWLAMRLAQDNPELLAFINECKHVSTAEADISLIEKKGISTGFNVKHPLTGHPIDIWISNFVLMSYGEGAVMGVPAHDERDFAFAKKYDLSIKQVITVGTRAYSTDIWHEWYADKTIGVCINSGKYDGLTYMEAVEAISVDLNACGLGNRQIIWRLRDWGISRQRYWGTPIPIIHCRSCGDVPVPEHDLPVLLPEDLIPNCCGNPLEKSETFLNCLCPKCGSNAQRETDTMDTFVDSSWYFLRYTAPDSKSMFDERADYWMPIDQYIGGIEHAILHLLYSRFWTKVLYDLGLVKFTEPVKRLLTQGMVLNETFYREDSSYKKTWYNPGDVTVMFDGKGRAVSATLNSDRQPVMLGGIKKMSKSKNNGVDPQVLINRYGADTARLFIIFAAAPEQQLEWSDSGVEGASRFLRRLWKFSYMHREVLNVHKIPNMILNKELLSNSDKTLRHDIYRLLKQANFDYQRLQYNTVVSASMKMLNTLDSASSTTTPIVLQEIYSVLLRVLYPIIPHITFELWKDLGYTNEFGLLLDAPWPKVDEKALEQLEIKLALQINGRIRGTINVAKDSQREEIEEAVFSSDSFMKFCKDKKLVKNIIIISGQLVNVVV
ncbi:MAG: leucine--tRNA ligase [Burkholderia sp.]|nr:leucine--tRNA ligase [Burkholderia sp.]